MDIQTKLSSDVTDLIAQIRKSPLSSITVSKHSLQRFSLFDSPVDLTLKQRILELANEIIAADKIDLGKRLDRVVGSMVGMAVADSLGHNFEFLPAVDNNVSGGPRFEYPSASTPGGVFHQPLNRFRLLPGQWTDDASMGLCLADSLLLNGKLDGSNLRVLFWNWWHNGLNNAFRKDRKRQAQMSMYGSLSVGLGGNISRSLQEIEELTIDKLPVPPKFESGTDDAGNGSLMRLAPIPIYFSTDVTIARKMAYEQSLATHPGAMAAEACDFMAYLIVSAIDRSVHDLSSSESAAHFIDAKVGEYLEILGEAPTDAKAELKRLLLSSEPDHSTERCWNWRDKFLGVEKTIANRGSNYNGYPVSPGYFGSFSLDGLAMALHCVYHTDSFNNAVAKVINFLGDADTTGSICGQLAGAFYGAKHIDKIWLENLNEYVY